MQLKLKAVICDIDNCLVDSSSIAKYWPTDKYSREQWDEYQTHINECTINIWCRDLIIGLNDLNYFIIFVTGREDRNNQRNDTIIQIGKNLRLNKCLLLMRKENDYRDDHIVKEELYNEFIKDYFNIKLAIDDMSANAELWKRLGITSLLIM
jgi:predicted secreted acid phosphatase